MLYYTVMFNIDFFEIEQRSFIISTRQVNCLRRVQVGEWKPPPAGGRHLEVWWKPCPNYSLASLFLSDCQIWWTYLKQPNHCDLNISSTAVLTLNFDLDLSKVNSDAWHRCWTSMLHFTKIGFQLVEKSIPPWPGPMLTNEWTNQQTNKQTDTTDQNTSSRR